MKQLLNAFVFLPAGIFCMGLQAMPAGETPLFPVLEGWETEVNEQVYTPGNLWDVINGAADAYLGYGFLDLTMASYKKSENQINVELYRHNSRENAFGIYSFERSPDYQFIDVGTEGYTGEGILNFLSGDYYVKIRSTDSSPQSLQAMNELAHALVLELKQENSWPEALLLLPVEGRVAHSERYVARNFLGFDFLHSAYTADYGAEREASLFLITTEQAGEVGRMLTRYLEFTRQDTGLVQQDSFTIKDPYNGDILIRHEGNVLCGVFNCDDPDLARTYLDRFGPFPAP